MRYTLRQLEVFLAIAQSESVSHAAKALGMSQSAASGALADLERQFEVQLFERVGKRLQLSGLGRSLRAPAEALQERARELEHTLAGHGETAELRVGATMSIGNYLMAPLIARFMREHPGSRVVLDVANTREIARKVSNFEIDVGLIEGELQDSELEVTRWRKDELVVFCSPNHPFAKKRSLSDEDLKAAAWIVRERGSGTRQAFELAMHGILPELDLVLELQHTEGIKSAVKAGLGVGCVSRIALEDAFRHNSLVPCSVKQRDFQRYFFFVLRKQKYRSAGLENWLALCRRA
ncbi:MAG TPA: LysR substrate-binding domain-containing protein [Polyangiaceae bacterium]|jgi:DNA-binding transcriptional LysR family regulator|nr:LysR substrate-binding domain-containing protein [Polyangiaceae bacterium]